MAAAAPDRTAAASGDEEAAGLDDFTRKLSADDCRVLVDLLKLSVANRAGCRAKEVLSTLLAALSKANAAVRRRLFLCCALKSMQLSRYSSQYRFNEITIC